MNLVLSKNAKPTLYAYVGKPHSFRAYAYLNTYLY